MTLTQTICPNHIALRMGIPKACSAEDGAMAPVFEKSGTELKQRLLKCKSTVQIATLNVRTLNRISQLPELSSLIHSIPKHNVLIIGGDMNAQTDKNINNKFCLHNSSNRNGEHITEFSHENEQTCLNTKFQKRKIMDLHLCK